MIRLYSHISKPDEKDILLSFTPIYDKEILKTGSLAGAAVGVMITCHNDEIFFENSRRVPNDEFSLNCPKC